VAVDEAAVLWGDGPSAVEEQVVAAFGGLTPQVVVIIAR